MSASTHESEVLKTSSTLPLFLTPNRKCTRLDLHIKINQALALTLPVHLLARRQLYSHNKASERESGQSGRRRPNSVARVRRAAAGTAAFCVDIKADVPFTVRTVHSRQVSRVC